MSNYQELLARKKELDQRIEQMQKHEAQKALAEIKELIATFEFTPQQVFPLPQSPKKKDQDKYYDPGSGNSWTGRGKPPKWIEGKDRSQFEIKTTTETYTAPRDPNNPFPFQ